MSITSPLSEISDVVRSCSHDDEYGNRNPLDIVHVVFQNPPFVLPLHLIIIGSISSQNDAISMQSSTKAVFPVSILSRVVQPSIAAGICLHPTPKNHSPTAPTANNTIDLSCRASPSMTVFLARTLFARPQPQRRLHAPPAVNYQTPSPTTPSHQIFSSVHILPPAPPAALLSRLAAAPHIRCSVREKSLVAVPPCPAPCRNLLTIHALLRLRAW
ncbi:uncharacterized protein BKA78DRAFT_324843 [Phyllosticta capitalensis]|uniref:uncharacterized protein n=1 Tax=Phyllosticta capitalensis TaxID=121624 RepID=UPI00312CEB9D